jgi:hypothetical protein
VLHLPGEILDELEHAYRFRWTHNEELLACILEKLDALIITTQMAWSEKGKGPRNRTPYRYPRPNPPKKKKRRPSTVEEIRRFFAR